MTERMKPYIGISGTVNPEQQQYLLNQFNNLGLDTQRDIAFGVKATHKTQYLDIENKYGRDWFPVGDEFSDVLETLPGSLNVAQVFLDPELVNDADYRDEFIKRIRRRGASWLQAVQFDLLPWHADNSLIPFLEQLKNESGLGVILQAHGESMQALGPDGMMQKLGQYATALDYVLFDASHGKGIRLNSKALQPFLEAAYSSDALGSVGFGVAGGLHAQVVREDLPVLVQQYPNMSWDAEGRLHPVRPEDSARPLDVRLATEYLEASAEVIRSV